MPAPADPRIELRDLRVLPENRSAVRAAKALARSVLLGKRVSVGPLVLHGPPGCGKTRLAASFVDSLTATSPEITARIEPAADLARPDSPDGDAGFDDRDLRACDVLVLEDIQHLPGRSAGSVCDLIDRRLSRRKVLVVTSASGPAELRHLPQRLTSRLAAGLVVPLEPLGVASRRELLAEAACEKNVRLTPDALDWLAARTGGLRQSLGAIQNLALVAPQFPGPLDRETVGRVLAETGQPTSRSCGVDAIIGRVAVVFGVSEKELLGPGRLRGVLLARQVAMYLARELAGLSLPRIGAAFGRDHTTVLHACRKIEAETDPITQARLRQLRKDLG